ncbi:MAG: hypothetical protein MZW92_77735 [Comamonadaceae bacterium]|nr:hypothetical protein [Comamonadaceae bacterium]
MTPDPAPGHRLDDPTPSRRPPACVMSFNASDAERRRRPGRRRRHRRRDGRACAAGGHRDRRCATPPTSSTSTRSTPTPWPSRRARCSRT